MSTINSFKTGQPFPEDQAMSRELELIGSPNSRRKMEIKFNHVINYSINHAYLMRPQMKTLGTEAQSLQFGK